MAIEVKRETSWKPPVPEIANARSRPSRLASDSEAFWGTTRDGSKSVPEPKPERRGSNSVSPSAPERSKSMLRFGTHRSTLTGAELGILENLSLLAAVAAQAEAEATLPKEVKHDVNAKSIQSGPKYIPGHRECQFRPERTNRETVFKEDLAKALQTEDVPLLLAMFSTALDLDARHSHSNMLADRHQVEAIKKKLRVALGKKVNAAMKSNDLAALKALLEEINSDKLMEAVTNFPEVHRARAYYDLKVAHNEVEASAQESSSDAAAHGQKVAALGQALRKAKKVETLDQQHVQASEALHAQQKGQSPGLGNTASTIEGGEAAPVQGQSPRLGSTASTIEGGEADGGFDEDEAF